MQPASNEYGDRALDDAEREAIASVNRAIQALREAVRALIEENHRSQSR